MKDLRTPAQANAVSDALAQLNQAGGSTDVAAKQVETLDQLRANPSIDTPTAVRQGPARRRVSLSIPTRKLEAPEIPGYHCYWFLRENVERAIEGGYEHVTRDEVQLNQNNISASSGLSGNQSLGNTVEVVTAAGAGPTALVLMKTRKEWFDEDQKILADRNMATIQAIFRKEALPDAGPGADTAQRYVREASMKGAGVPILNRGLRKQS